MQDNNDFDASTIPYNILHNHLVYMVKYHQAILDVADDYERIFSKMVLFEFFGCVMIICTAMYHVSTVT